MASIEKAGYGHPGALAEIRRLALIRFDSMYLASHTYMTHTICLLQLFARRAWVIAGALLIVLRRTIRQNNTRTGN